MFTRNEVAKKTDLNQSCPTNPHPLMSSKVDKCRMSEQYLFFIAHTILKIKNGVRKSVSNYNIFELLSEAERDY